MSAIKYRHLTLRAIAGSFFGLLVLHLPGDRQIVSQLEDVPEVLATLFFDGVQAQQN